MGLNPVKCRFRITPATVQIVTTKESVAYIRKSPRYLLPHLEAKPQGLKILIAVVLPFVKLRQMTQSRADHMPARDGRNPGLSNIFSYC